MRTARIQTNLWASVDKCRLNRAYWPTKENRQKMGPDGFKSAQEDFFLLIQTLPTFWAERIWILRIFIFWIFWAPSLGPAWARLFAQLGPGLGLGLGPGLGPDAAGAAAGRILRSQP